MPALPLTPEQKEDAARLKRLFLKWQGERKANGEPSSQDAFSDLVGFGQSAVNQYLNGKIPLNPAAAAKFSRVLKCQISDFSEAVAEQASAIALATSRGDSDASDRPDALDITELSKPETQLVLMFRELGQGPRNEVLRFARVLHQAAVEDKRMPVPPPPNVKVAPQSQSMQKKKEDSYQ